VSGRYPPHRRGNPDRFRHALPPPRFLAALKELGGTTPEILAHPDLMALAEPPLRADFALTELYAHVEEAALDCPILALTGEADAEVSVAEMAEWSRHAAAGFELVTMPGDHFYLRDRTPEMVAHLTRCAAPA
jgi:pyochelin biosynthetic protein PchC